MLQQEYLFIGSKMPVEHGHCRPGQVKVNNLGFRRGKTQVATYPNCGLAKLFGLESYRDFFGNWFD